jgi:hypothetical protein
VSGSRKPDVAIESGGDDDEEEHDELEEDQLIDDEDDGIQVHLKHPLSVTLPAPAVKPKPNPKKRSRKVDKPETKPGASIQAFDN